MIVITIVLPEGHYSFVERQYEMMFDAAIQDIFDPVTDIKLIDYALHAHALPVELKPGVPYTFFLNRANIQTAYPGYESAFDIWQIVENVGEINVQL